MERGADRRASTPRYTAAMLRRVAVLLALCSGIVAAAPLILTTSRGVTTLSGTVAGWTLGQRALAFADGSASRAWQQGRIDAQGRFVIALPTPAQLAPLSWAAGERYTVVGCDDQPSDFLVDGPAVRLYDLPSLSVLRARPDRAASYEAPLIADLPKEGKVTLMYASDDVTISVNVSCPRWGDVQTTRFDLRLKPGWNAVLSRAGKDTVLLNAPAKLPAHWVYTTR